MRLFTGSRLLFLIFITTSIIGAVLWYFAGVSGEAFLVDKNRQVLPAPGASIQIYQSGDSNKGVGGFLISNVSGNKKYTDDLIKVSIALQKAQHLELSEDKAALLTSLPEQIKQTYCQTLIMGHSGYFGVPIESLNADRSGRFSSIATREICSFCRWTSRQSASSLDGRRYSSLAF